MPNIKNAEKATKTATERINTTTTTHHASQKQHSTPFYISPQLFQNKRLKQKRLRRELVLEDIAKRRSAYSKTEWPNPDTRSLLQPAITIDLLSDDDNEPEAPSAQHKPTPPPPLPAAINGNHVPHATDPLGIGQLPSISLVPVRKQPQSAPTKRKRKTRPDKRHAHPTIVNNESIVLSDDDVNGNDAEDVHPVLLEPLGVDPAEARGAITIISQMAQVDNEVTVSLVPRSSKAGNCAPPKPQPEQDSVPQLPDETTVHTVIANRTYELSLAKLREGLASSGHSEFADEQQKISPVRRKGQNNAAPATSPSQMAPVSLKLSSDLSISLISDDEEDADVAQELLSPAQLLEQQPQLLVQQVGVVAAGAMATDARQVPRRRKLG